MRYILTILFFLTIIASLPIFANEFYLCPLCNSNGKITCPVGYKAGCSDAVSEMTTPECLFIGNMYAPGCWKFIGIRKMDFNFGTGIFPPSWMVEVTGGGETYFLNQETIKCQKETEINE